MKTYNVEGITIGDDLVCAGCTAGIKYCVHIPKKNQNVFCRYYRGSTFTKDNVFKVLCIFDESREKQGNGGGKV